MSERHVRKIDGVGNATVTDQTLRFDVEMEVDGSSAGFVPVFAEIDKLYSVEDASTLRRLLADGRRRAVAEVYPPTKPSVQVRSDSAPPSVLPENRPPTGSRRAGRRLPSGLRFLKPEVASPPTPEPVALPVRPVKQPRSASPVPAAPADAPPVAVDVTPLPLRPDKAPRKPYVAPAVVDETALTSPSIDPEPATLPARPRRNRR